MRVREPGVTFMLKGCARRSAGAHRRQRGASRGAADARGAGAEAGSAARAAQGAPGRLGARQLGGQQRGRGGRGERAAARPLLGKTCCAFASYLYLMPRAVSHLPNNRLTRLVVPSFLPPIYRTRRRRCRREERPRAFVRPRWRAQQFFRATGLLRVHFATARATLRPPAARAPRADRSPLAQGVPIPSFGAAPRASARPRERHVVGGAASDRRRPLTV